MLSQLCLLVGRSATWGQAYQLLEQPDFVQQVLALDAARVPAKTQRMVRRVVFTAGDRIEALSTDTSLDVPRVR